MRIPSALLAVPVLAGLASAQDFEPTWESLDRRALPQWFADARFGIFLHWGVYSVPAFCDTSTYSEWYQHWLDTNSHGGLVRKFHERVYGADFAYRQFAEQFRAELWDPAEWAKVFARSGAQYVVITSKHHDGFCLWPSDVASEVRGHPWNSVATGPQRDLLGDLAAAVRAEGLRFGLYYSFMEWHNPVFERSIPDYVDQVLFPQVKDLIARYQPSIFWPDGEWNHPDATWRSTELLQWIYANAPNREELVVNDRWGKGCRGEHGDFYTTEYGSYGGSKTLLGQKPFEECRGIGHSFAFNRAEGYDVYLSRTECVRTLIDLVSRGGNLLLDIGPDADGTIPLIMVDRLLAMGRWLQVHGEAIHGTTRSPFRETPWGRATKKGTTLYLHVFDWPAGGRLAVPGLRNGVSSARLLSDDKRADLPRMRDGNGVLHLDLRGHLPAEHSSVVRLELDGEPRIDRRLLPAADGSVTLSAAAAEVQGKALKLENQMDRGVTRWNLGYWSSTEDRAIWRSVQLPPGTYDIEVEVAVAPGEGGGELLLTLVDPEAEQKAFGTSRYPFRVPLDQATKGWRDYTVVAPSSLTTVGGLVEFHASASRIDKAALCNLRRITFRPKADRRGAAVPAGLDPTTRELVTVALRSMQQDLEAGRHGDVAARYADTAVLLGPGGAPVTGREAIDGYWARIGAAKSWDLEIWETRGSGPLVHQLGRSTLVRERDGAEQASVVDFALTWRAGPDGSLRIVSDIYWDPGPGR